MALEQPSRVDPKIWQSCAGDTVKIPKLHSKVYYFPLGHLEHANPTPNTESLSLINSYRPFIPCIISSVDLLADPQTDEVFTKLLLTPVIDGSTVEPFEVHDDDDGGDDDVVSSGKTLSQSDANNGGAFSVPSKCAKLIFPPLDLEAKLPTQELSIADVHGNVWEFRHVYRGNPKRHMFTHNWSQFVDKKKLVGGDSLLFMKNSAGEIYVGIRRVKKFATPAVMQKKESVVIEAVKLAEKNEAFEVVYYPTADDGDNFVVDANVVEDAMKINWNCGMRVKRSLNNDDSSISLQHGTITNLCAPSDRPWHMLQLKVTEDPAALLSDIQGDSSIPIIEFQHSTMEKFVDPNNCDTKNVTRSFKLFGTIIQVGSDLPNSEIKEDDSC
ncbi:auxin response factor 17-like [Trifolium pratense]|uniref:auxin response factor 17-like n=1 Tax=Trifolium pratense TaxID=57577 RepID=UPI001E6937BF|nr:auxin response factor 17-like [Trifolium pratense]